MQWSALKQQHGCEADIQTGSCTGWLTIYMLVLNVQYNMCEEKSVVHFFITNQAC